jgi:uridine phosphorylase
VREDESITKPCDAVRYCAKNRKIPVDALGLPQRLVLTYLHSTFQCAKKLVKGTVVEWIYGQRMPFCIGEYKGVEVGVGQFWIGAPAATAILEEVIECGVKKVFEVGLSGGIQPYLKPGDVVVVTEAIRDEGTSFHYLPPKVKVHSDPSLRKKLAEYLGRKGMMHYVGPVWSTDAAYRETVGKVRKFREKGVLCVDMETSAIFSLAGYRHVQAVSAQVISDILTESNWKLAFGYETVVKSEKALLKAVLEVLSQE